MNGKARFIIPVIGLALLFILVLLQVFGGAEQEGQENRSVWGYWAFDRFLRQAGYRLGGTAAGLPDNSGKTVLIHFADTGMEESYAKAINGWLDDGHVLLLVGLPEDEFFTGDLTTTGKNVAPFLDESFADTENIKTEQELLQVVKIDSAVIPLIRAGSDHSVVLRLKHKEPGQILIVSDDVFLRNRRFLANEHAVMMNRVLAGYEDYTFFYSRNAHDRPYLGMQVFIRGKLGLFMLQLLILCLLGGWHLSVRYGRADILPKDRRRDLTEHLTAVGRMYSQTTHWKQFGRMEKQFFVNQLRAYLPRGGDDRKALTELLRGVVDDSVVISALNEGFSSEDLKQIVENRQIILRALSSRRSKNGS